MKLRLPVGPLLFLAASTFSAEVCVAQLDVNAPSPAASRTAAMSRMAQVIYISGRVQLEDGSPPPEPAVIQRVCSTMTRNEAFTDRKGRFSFRVGGGQPIMADASLDASGNGKTGMTSYQLQSGSVPTSELQSSSSLIDCDLRVEEPGYRPDVVHLDRINMLEKGDIGTIILHRSGGSGGLTVSATTIAAPKEAVKAYQQGLKEASQGNFRKARGEFEKAVKQYPLYAIAWVGVGLACEQLKDADGAVHAYQEANKADEKLLKPVERLTILSDQGARWPESAKYSAAWIELDRIDYPYAYLLNAVANIRLDKLDVAEKSAREGLRLDPDAHLPRLRYVLGYIMAARNQLTEAVNYFHDYLKMDPNGSDAPALRGQLPGLEQAAAAERRP
ncbi:MAG TPA: tetratricopeptide repeat protein [Bryobacteraceae bacterium]|nr:tetratricopeptide repeat protein [Bryobacteraceae bacterium]